MEKASYKRILFLDIDGVLASVEYLCRTVRQPSWIDTEKVKLLNKLKDYGVEVVISSSWGYNEDTVKQLKNTGLELPIIGGTEHFHVDWMCRGNEIAKWLVSTFEDYNVFDGRPYGYEGKDYEYVILDDDSDMLLCQADNFVHVNNETALTEEDIQKCINILTRKNKTSGNS
jgi:hypothetical protein